MLHPVRMRILQAFLGGAEGRRLTAGQLGRELSDVAHATLYRHLNRLADAGVLAVVEERAVRGATEKVYALPVERALLTGSDLAGRSRQDLLRDFATFLGLLLHDFSRYLAREDVDLVRDGVGYRHTVVYASDAELAELRATLADALLPFVRARPAPGRRRHVLAAITLPATGDPEANGTEPTEPEEERR